ncbi:MAG: maleylpyruvate isomerase family mycothiol-dependent enzyme [Acidimicrobiia bacterium]
MPIDYLTHLRREMAAISAAGRRGPLDAAVVHCPGWDLARLVGHVGRVYRMATIAVLSGSPEQSSEAPERPPTEGDIVSWFDTGASALIDALASTPVDAPAFNFSKEPRTAAFWSRRQAHESLIHRFDAESAVGTAAPLDAELAVDSIEEIFSMWVPLRLGERDDIDLGGTMHIHATDADGEWMVRVVDGRIVVEHGHAKGDVAVRGPASSLALLLWHRLPADDPSLERFGDPGVLDRWLALNVPG